MKLWKSKKSVTASSAGGGGGTTGCAGGGTHKGGILSKSCKTLGGSGGKANGSGSFDEHTAETSFVTPAAAPGTDGTVAVLSSMVQHLPSNLFVGSERAMSPAQSEDSGLAADRGTTYATISIPRDIGQIGIVLVERTDLSLPPIVESIVGPVGDLLAPGDRIHQVDGISTIGLTNQHICSILDHGEDPAVIEIEYSFPEYISQNSLCVTTKIVQITVERENGCLGLTLRGGGEYPLVVTNVRPNGPVFRAGQIKPGDRVLRVDNISLLNKSLSEAQHILKDAHVSGYTNLTIEYDVSVMQTVELSLGPLLLEIERPLNEKLGLALSYYSNATHPAGPLYHSTYKLNQEVVPDGIYIASIMPASIADRCGALSVGDQILAIDETLVEGGACTLEEATALLDANCVKGYSQLHILPAHTFVRRRGFSYSSPRYGFNTVDSRKQLAGSKHRRLLRKSSLPQPMEDLHGPPGAASVAPPVGGLCKAEKIHIILDCSQGSGICLGPKTGCGRGFVVAQVLPDSVAERSGCLQKGDRITAVNKMCNLEVGAVRQILGDFGPVAAANHYHNQPQTSNWVELEVEFDMADTVVPASGVFTIKLLKHGRYGLGITVNGNGSESFVVSEVKPGSAAHRTGSLRAGDVLLAVDNRPLQHYNLDQLLKESSNELITLTVKRTSASPSFLLGDAASAQQPKSCSVYGCADETDFAYGHRFQSEEQRLRHPVWSNAIVPYDVPVSAGDASSPRSTEQPLPLPPAHLLGGDQGEPVAGDGDRYDDDIMHYKMASMNIANYVGYSAIGSFPKSHSATGFSHEQPSPPPPPLPHVQRHQLQQQRVFNVRLEPDGGPLGITLAASEDLQKPIKISALTEGGIAYNTGQLQLGDRLLAINGESIVGIPLTTATKLLQKFDNAVDLQIARPVTPDPAAGGDEQLGVDSGPGAVYAQVQQRPRSPAPDAKGGPASSNGSAGGVAQRTLQVTLFKDRVYDDYGFSVSDGLYERGVYINRIRSGGPADMAGLLRPFDRIVQVNGTKTQDFDCCLTVPLIAAAGDKIELAIQRTLPE